MTNRLAGMSFGDATLQSERRTPGTTSPGNATSARPRTTSICFVRWRTDRTQAIEAQSPQSNRSSDMAKGQQRSNREAKKPKKPKAPAAIPASTGRTADKGARFIPVRPK